MCSLVANYDSDEEQQNNSKKAKDAGSKTATEKNTDFGWSLMQANVQRDMEISDDDAQKEEETIPAKQLRRKKRIDFVTTTKSSKSVPPPAGFKAPEESPISENSAAPDNGQQKLLTLETVTLPSFEFTCSKVVNVKGYDDEIDSAIQSKLSDCLLRLSSYLNRNFEKVDKVAPLLVRVQCLQDAWQEGALDSNYLSSKLDSILENRLFSASSLLKSKEQATLFPTVPSDPEEVLASHKDPSTIVEGPAPQPPLPLDDMPPPPPPPEPDDSLGTALDSFYSEMAGIEAAQETKKDVDKNDKTQTKEAEAEVVKPEPPEPVVMVNKSRKGKISTSVGMKRKNVSTLMDKWNKVKKEWEGD